MALCIRACDSLDACGARAHCLSVVVVAGGGSPKVNRRAAVEVRPCEDAQADAASCEGDGSTTATPDDGASGGDGAGAAPPDNRVLQDVSADAAASGGDGCGAAAPDDGAMSCGITGEVVVLQESSTLFVNLVKMPRMSLGVQTDITQQGYLRVGNLLKRGIIPFYNRGAPPDEQIQVGDCFMSINGERDASKQHALTQQTGELWFEVRRPRRFTVCGLDTSQGSLGVSVMYFSKSTAAYISNVNPDGLVHRHNLMRPSFEVRAGDHIAAINGRGVTGDNIVPMLRAETVVDLTIEQAAENVPAEDGGGGEHSPNSGGGASLLPIAEEDPDHAAKEPIADEATEHNASSPIPGRGSIRFVVT